MHDSDISGDRMGYSEWGTVALVAGELELSLGCRVPWQIPKRDSRLISA